MILLLLSLLATPALATEDDLALAATVAQQQLPEWQQRRETALRQLEARERLFAGAGSVSEAFPHWIGRATDDLDGLEALLLQLQRGDLERAGERQGQVPEVDEALARRWSLARSEALDAEDRASALERRGLLALQAQLRAHPALSRAAIAELGASALAARSRPLPDDPEARPQALAELAAADDQLAALDRLASALRLRALLPQAPPPSPDEDLERLPAEGWPAANRLELMLPFLPPPQREAVASALAEWIRGVPLAAATRALQADHQAPTGKLQALRDQLAARQTALARLTEAPSPGGDGPVAQAKRALLDAQRAEAALQVKAAEGAVQAASTDLAEAEARARQTDEAAQVARERADAAHASAQDEAARTTADILSASADAQAQAAAAWQEVREAEAASASWQEALETGLGALSAQLDAVGQLSLLDPARPDPDPVLQALRGRLDTLRAEESSSRERVRAARITLQRIPPTPAPEAPADTPLGAAQRELASALEQVRGAKERSAEVAVGHHRAVLRALDLVADLHDRALSAATLAARRADRGHLLLDVAAELRLLPPRTGLWAADRLTALWDLPRKALDFNALRAFFVGSFWFLAVAAGWWLGRGRAADLAGSITAWVARQRAELAPEDLEPVRPLLSQGVRLGLDMTAGLLALGVVYGVAPELGLLLSVYLHWTVFRLATLIHDLTLARFPEVRPALRTLLPETHALTSATVRLSVGLLLVRRLTLWGLGEALGVHTLADLVAWGFALAGLLLFGWLGWRWEPILRGTLARRRQDSALVAYLSAPPRHPLLILPHSAMILGFLALALAMEVLPHLGREGTQLGSLVTKLGSYRLRTGAPHHTPLSEVLREELIMPRSTTAEVGVREQAVAECLTALEDAARDPGVLLVSADTGQGKSAVMVELARRLSASGVAVRHLRLDQRLTGPMEALRWLATQTGVGAGAPGDEALSRALLTLPRTTWVVDDLHLAFLRRVGGFTPLAALLAVMGSTSPHHTWIVSLHQPAWHYLSRVGGLLPTGVVRHTVQLGSMGERALRVFLTDRAASAGIRADFNELVRVSPFGDDPTVELERATSLFFRMLAESSGGNPTVALHLWAGCLAEPDGDGVSEVFIGPSLARALPDGLELDALFLLAALRSHGRLLQGELADTTLISAAKVAALLRQLRLQGLVEEDGGGLRVPPRWQTAVSRALARRNIIQWQV
ncbi:MAG: hypothetical protein JXX28_01445 [Deltaproteobacteria bacterium]|nr:hypothetical protein [Deltaproteobacteria bacterium]